MTTIHPLRPDSAAPDHSVLTDVLFRQEPDEDEEDDEDERKKKEDDDEEDDDTTDGYSE